MWMRADLSLCLLPDICVPALITCCTYVPPCIHQPDKAKAMERTRGTKQRPAHEPTPSSRTSDELNEVSGGHGRAKDEGVPHSQGATTKNRNRCSLIAQGAPCMLHPVPTAVTQGRCSRKEPSPLHESPNPIQPQHGPPPEQRQGKRSQTPVQRKEASIRRRRQRTQYTYVCCYQGWAQLLTQTDTASQSNPLNNSTGRGALDCGPHTRRAATYSLGRGAVDGRYAYRTLTMRE
ncbi:hypothetical protein BJ912DRAFT_392962 [Pholiota molesta]|nr:hypothetical protein BJ912DRAFT_392962 [Pholiota molesta]